MGVQTYELPTSVPTLRNHTVRLYKQVQSHKEKLRKVGEANSKIMDGAIELTETIGAAFAISYMNGRYGNTTAGTPYQIAGFDLDIGLAAVLAAAGMFDLLGEKYSGHLFTLAGGCAAGWATREGLALGAKANTTSGTTTTTASTDTSTDTSTTTSS